VRPAIAWVEDKTKDGDANLYALFAHPDCIRVAHPDFDLDSNAASGYL
jgi:hypothetical protein